MNVFDNRTLQSFFAFGDVVNLDPGQALGTVDLDKFGVSINFTAGHFCTTRHAQCNHATAQSGGGHAEHLEVHIGHHIGEFCEFHAHAQIRFVRAKAVHRLAISHHRKLTQVRVEHRFEDVADHALEHVANVLLAHEGCFDINLREFRLAVSAQVFIAKAFGDLVVTIKPRHHQQLLEQLRALRQCEKHAFVDPAGHQIVACAFGCAFGQHRGFNVNETVGIQKLAGFHGHAVAQHQVVLHVRAAQVQHAVRQAGGF